MAKDESVSVSRGGRRLARMLVATPLIYGGYNAAKSPGARSKLLSRVGLPESDVLVRVNGVAMVVGGFFYAAGVLPRLAAAGLTLSLIPTTVAGHAFWGESDPNAKRAQAIQFAKNLSTVGALILDCVTPA